MSTDLVPEIPVPPRVSSQDRILELVRRAHPNYHPVVAMATLAFVSEDEGIQLSCHKEIAKYTVAVDRFVEVKSEVKQTKRVIVELFGGPDQRAEPKPVLEATDDVNVTRITDVVDKRGMQGQVDTVEQRTTIKVSGPAEHEEETAEPKTVAKALLGVWGDGSQSAGRFA